MPRSDAPRKRCAIYTRKSSEEGLALERAAFFTSSAQQKAMLAARAWAMAEAEGRIQKQGGDRGKTPKVDVLIANPREHFGLGHRPGHPNVRDCRDNRPGIESTSP